MSDATRLFDAAPAPVLTAEERARVSGGVDWSAGEHAGRKALRIIDAHAADRAALVARVAELKWEIERLTCLACDADKRAAESECATLRQRLEVAERNEAWLRKDRDTQVGNARADRAAAESELAAANALLGRIGVWADTYGAAIVPHGGTADTYGDGVRACKAQVKAMLSGQPAAPRTAEQRVLDTMAAIPQKDLEWTIELHTEIEEALRGAASAAPALTAEERARVELVGTNRERRHARIIDAHAADRAALVEQLRVKSTQYETAFRERAEAEAALQQGRADRAALVARVAELEAEAVALDAAHRRMLAYLDEGRTRWEAAEQQLAAANALLGRIPDCLLTDCPVYADLMAHLSTQRDSK